MQPPDDADGEVRSPSRNQVDPESRVTASSSGRSMTSLFSRILFQKLLLMAVVRLSVYVFKLVEDANSVKEYEAGKHFKFMLISAACLIVPPVFYSIYLMGQNLTKDDVIDRRELGTKAVNGLLLIPWQIKRHLDVLHYSAQRVCAFRPPTKSENQELQSMERHAEILEFFEDLYAGFLQILLQVYLILLHPDVRGKVRYYELELVASVLSVTSMLIAVRRRDDGPLTAFLSLFGWSSLIISRVLSISLAATQIHGWIAVLALIHVFGMSYWVYGIAVESHTQPAEPDSQDKDHWNDTRKRSSTAIMVFLFFGIPSLVIWPFMFQLKQGKRPFIFLSIMVAENLLLTAIWMAGTGSELSLKDETTLFHLLAIIVTTVTGVFFLLIYVFCKPKYTDQVVLFDIREARTQEAHTLIQADVLNSRTSNATQYGIYYEFCDLVFKLPSTRKLASDLEEIRGLTRPATHSDATEAD